MKVRRQQKENMSVIWGLCALMLLGMMALLFFLWKLQVPRKGSFEELLIKQTVRRVQLPATRGKIYDRNGAVLADNVPNYSIVIYPRELRNPRSAVANTLELMHNIWQLIGREYASSNAPALSYSDILAAYDEVEHMKKVCKEAEITPVYKPLIAWDHLNDATAKRCEKKIKSWTFIENKTNELGQVEASYYQVPGLLITNDYHTIAFDPKRLASKASSTAANVLELIYKIEARTGIKRTKSLKNIQEHLVSKRALPFFAWENLTQEQMARWANTCSDLPANDLYCQDARYYPQGENLAHVIGVSKKAYQVISNSTATIDYVLPRIKGTDGIEKRYDQLMTGTPGAKIVQVDASSYFHTALSTKAPLPGGDLMLAIDAHIQEMAMRALSTRIDSDLFAGPVRGAVVVLNPTNGDVLALGSSPSYDPNRYMTDWRYIKELYSNKKAAATFNRAVQGTYPPGSTFKPIAALGVLRTYPEYAHITHTCRQYYEGKKKCTGAHGTIDIRQMLQNSCNIYMFEMVRNCAKKSPDDDKAYVAGYEVMRAMAEEFGLGKFTGLFPNLDEEPTINTHKKYGNLPQRARWRKDAQNLAIGQGEHLASPLQMAMACAAIANGGTLYRPRLIKKFRHKPTGPFQTNPVQINHRITNLPAEALAIVRAGMRDVIMGRGTKKPLFTVGNIIFAGKTGTAEYGHGRNKDGSKKQYTWMISYAPFDHPRYAIAMVVEDGVYGSKTIAPRLEKLYSDLFTYDGTLQEDPQ